MSSWFPICGAGDFEKTAHEILTFLFTYVKISRTIFMEVTIMEHIKTIETRNLCDSAVNGGCGECQTSCQSACKTSCGIANQACENEK